MGYAKGVRHGHASGHLREPACALVESIYSSNYTHDAAWWEVDAGDGHPFPSAEAAYRHLGRLWHCRDTVPGSTRRAARSSLDVGDDDVLTYSQLVRHLRGYITDMAA